MKLSYSQLQWHIQRLPDAGILVWAPKLCAQIKEIDAKQHQLFNIFNANASTPSLKFNLSNALKIVQLKTLCMPVSATLVCLNLSQSMVCINKSGLYIVIVHKGVPAPLLFKAPTPWPSLPSLFKIFVSPPLFSVPPSFKVFRQFPPPSQPPSALIQPPTNLPWFKQISKG